MWQNKTLVILHLSHTQAPDWIISRKAWEEDLRRTLVTLHPIDYKLGEKMVTININENIEEKAQDIEMIFLKKKQKVLWG